jgi:hypothetical protein
MSLSNFRISGAEIFNPRWNSKKRQIEFARVWPGGIFESDAQMSLYIGFEEFNRVKSAPAVGSLNLFADQVGKVIAATEAKCREIGLLST